MHTNTDAILSLRILQNRSLHSLEKRKVLWIDVLESDGKLPVATLKQVKGRRKEFRGAVVGMATSRVSVVEAHPKT